jgi:hypothetical protein
MALQGELRDFNILEVIQLLGQQGKTGVLRVWEWPGGGRCGRDILCRGQDNPCYLDPEDARRSLGGAAGKDGRYFPGRPV